MDLGTFVLVVLAAVCGILGCMVYSNYKKVQKRKETMCKISKMIMKNFKK